MRVMERQFEGYAVTTSAWSRLVTVGAAVCGVIAVPAAKLPLAGAIAAVAVAWAVGYFFWLRSGLRPRLLTVVDLTLVSGFCLSQTYTVPASEGRHGNTWILVTVSIVAVTYQMTRPGPTGTAAALLLAGADLAGVVLDRPATWGAALPNVLWLLVQSALARAFYGFLLRRSRAADEAAASAAAVRRDLRVAAARHAAEREYLATLHDTACATLLMASLPRSDLRPEVLRAQARRDLERLTQEQDGTGDVDLAVLLHEEIRAHPLQVSVRFGTDLGSTWRPAADALRGSMGEALRNVARHAGVDRAEVSARRDGHRTVVTVRDRGVGFDSAVVPGHRHGLTRSVVARMHTVGGRATVASRPGEGTTVRMEWPRG
ncbi:hypothetical protein AVL59_11555 [Streptomyces griseochromogenes]|uniref:Histidine kinase/HSP90-like ATPase domain-containing protein n=1 Tax=Streptomyces griseochromogenes TaxID=68214 RepID=A0A1B1AUB6_9ACTN|nr:hypothetical protein AVL59_11555 [Streptomyces griseochromogenes]